MSRVEIVSVEQQNCRSSVPEWTDALSTCVGRVPLSSVDQEVTSCVPAGEQKFAGRIEWGMLGDTVLAKVETKTPHRLVFSLRATPLTVPAPVVLLFQMSGSCRVQQHSRSSTLGPGNCCLVDTHHPFHISSLDIHNENLSLRLERPSDPELLGLLARGIARRWNGTTGASRILQATLTETFNQMNCLGSFSETGLQRALAKLVWTALREQLEMPPRLAHGDVQRARIKNFIESRLADPDLSVCSIAQACGMSARSVHRAFAADPNGSVSKYVWMRRVSHCAADLRDPKQAHRPVTDMCFSWGFNSTSHFSRLFKEQFGVTPRDYRVAFEIIDNTNHRADRAA